MAEPATPYAQPEPAAPAASERQRRARRFAQLLGALATALGGAVWLGHVLGVEGVAWFGLPSMVGNTALMVFLAGCSLWLLAPRERSDWRTLTARLAAGMVASVAAATLGEYLFGLDGSQFDLCLLPGQWLPETVRWPGRPSPHTAVSFLLLGLALVLLDRGGDRLFRPPEVLAILGLALPFVALLGYVFDVEALYGVPGLLPYTAMALPTTVALLLVGSGVLLARPEVGLGAVLSSEGPGGVAARRMLVGMATLPPLAMLAFVAAEQGLFPVPVAASLVVVTWVGGLLGFVMYTAVRLERTAEAAREGERVRARMAALVASSADAIIATTPDAVVTDWNVSAERIYGYSASEMLGRSLFLLLEPQDRESRAVVERVRRGEPVPDFESVRVHKDGTAVPVSVSVAPIRGPGGEVVGISSISRDISARREIEAARDLAERERIEGLRRERAAREELARVLEAGGAVADALPALPAASLNHVLTVVALEAQALTGAGMVAVGGDGDPDRPFEHWVYTGVEASVANAIGRKPRARGVLGVAAVQGRVVRVRDVHQHPAFEGLPEHHPEVTSVLAVPVRFNGRPVGNIYLGNKTGGGGFSEADERVVLMLAARAGAAIETARLYESEAHQRVWLQSVFDQMPEGVVIVDRDGQVTHTNHVARAHLRAPNERGPVFCSPSGVPLLPEEQPAQRVLATGVTLVSLDLSVHGPGGELVPVLVSATPVRTSEGVAGSVVLYRDAHAIKELERLREEWASVVAHDLRQPLAVIRTGVEVLHRYGGGRLAGPEAATLRSITDGARRLDRMIDDLTDASRIEAHLLTLDRRDADLTALVADAVTQVRRQEPERRLVVEAEPGLRASVDADRIRQVMANLLSNAVKYGEPGAPIHVRLRRRDDATVQLTVSNRGPGIPPDELGTLFSRFSRTRDARAGGVPGSGIGLYISRGIVDAHAGCIWAESTPGETTDFHLVLPVNDASSALASAGGEPGNGGPDPGYPRGT